MPNGQSEGQTPNMPPEVTTPKLAFVNNLQSGKVGFLQVFLDAVEDAVNLEIVTVVEESSDDPTKQTEQKAERKKRASELGGSGEVLYTRINQVQGDIVNIVGAKFTADPYKELQDFHKEQVLKGEDIIKRNVELLKEIIEYAIKLKDQSKP